MANKKKGQGPEELEEEILTPDPKLLEEETDEEHNEKESGSEAEKDKTVKEDGKPKAEKQTKAKSPAKADEEKSGGYEEWEVKITNGADGKPKAEKLKLVRKSVKISEEEAETLNRGVLEGGNTYARMYYLPK